MRCFSDRAVFLVLYFWRNQRLYYQFDPNTTELSLACLDLWPRGRSWLPVSRRLVIAGYDLGNFSHMKPLVGISCGDAGDIQGQDA